MKRLDRARYEQLLERFEKQEFMAMMVPSILPPPIRGSFLFSRLGCSR